MTEMNVILGIVFFALFVVRMSNRTKQSTNKLKTEQNNN